MKITCSIQNNSGGSHDKLLIRKFFQIVFIENELDKVTIYTAIVLGDGTGDSPFSKLDAQFEVGFSFGSEDSTITHEDITSKFLEQPDRIRSVWGKDCDLLKTQRDKSDILKQVLPDTESVDNKYISNDDYLYIEQKKDARIDSLLKSIAHKGCFATDASQFSIKADSNFHVGVETVNWIKTSVKFKKNLKQDDLMEYDFFFDPKIALIPDFTFYISPPTNCIVDADSATVTYQKTDETTKTESNLISPVARAEQCYFNEWKKYHYIGSKKMSRLVIKNFTNPYEPATLRKIDMKFNIINRNASANIQFIIGILLSAFIALGTDFTRLEKISDGFVLVDVFPLEIQWTVACVLPFFTILIANIHIGSKEMLPLKCLRRVGQFLFLAWFVFAFVLRDVDFDQVVIRVEKYVLTSSILLNLLFIILAVFVFRTEYPLKTMLKQMKI